MSAAGMSTGDGAVLMWLVVVCLTVACFACEGWFSKLVLGAMILLAARLAIDLGSVVP